MSRRYNATLPMLLGAALAVVFVAGCGSANATPSTTAPVPTATATASPSGTPIASPSASIAGSPAPSSSEQSLPHVNAALEDQLPSTAGTCQLIKWSQMLTGFIAGKPTGGDKPLYAPWLKELGQKIADIRIAISACLLDGVNFNVRAVEVPGSNPVALNSSLADVARKAGWTVVSHVNYLPGKSIIEITDPVTMHPGYVYSKGDVLYTIVTDDQALLNEALIDLP